MWPTLDKAEQYVLPKVLKPRNLRVKSRTSVLRLEQICATKADVKRVSSKQ
jgi:hypothetical protein